MKYWILIFVSVPFLITCSVVTTKSFVNYPQSYHKLQSEFIVKPANDQLHFKMSHYGILNRSTPIVFLARLIVGLEDGSLGVFSNRTGERIWQRKLDSSVMIPCVVVENTIIAATDTGTVAAYDIETGDVKWTAPLKTGLFEKMIANETDVVVKTVSSVVMLNPVTGAIKWKYEKKKPSSKVVLPDNSLVRYNDKLLVGFYDGSLVVLNALDGAVLKELTIADRPSSDALDNGIASLLLNQDRVIVAAYSGNIQAYGLADYSQKWAVTHDEPLVSMNRDNDWLVIVDSKNRINIMDVKTGAAVDIIDGNRFAPTHFRIQKVFPAPFGWVVTSVDRDVFVIDPKTKQTREVITIGSGVSSDITIDGRWMYMVSNQGNIYGYSF